MKEYISLFFRIGNLIMGVACLITSLVSFFKGDVMHISLAYFAASYVFLDYAARK